MCVFVNMWTCMWRSEDNLQESVLSSTVWVLGIEFIRLSGKYLYLLSHSSDLFQVFAQAWSLVKYEGSYYKCHKLPCLCGFILLIIFWARVSCSPGWLLNLYVAKVGLQLFFFWVLGLQMCTTLYMWCWESNLGSQQAGQAFYLLMNEITLFLVIILEIHRK